MSENGNGLKVPSGLKIIFLFSQRQPFWGAKRLSGPDRKEAENQTVPTLEELLKEAAVLNLSIMFDLRRPPRNHTYHDTFVNQTLETVLSARVPQAMVILPGPKCSLLPLSPATAFPRPTPTHILPSVVRPLFPRPLVLEPPNSPQLHAHLP